MQKTLAKKLFAVGTALVTAAALLPVVAQAAVHPAGFNVLSQGTVWFINAAGQKQAYTSAGCFLSYGTNSWSNVVAASAEDLALPSGPFVACADGSVINDKGTVYIITNGQRAGITTPAVFLGLGYSWSQVVPGDTSFMTTMAPISSSAMAHLPGTLVNINGTVWFMGSNGKLGIPTPAVFNSWGFSWNNVLVGNSYDVAVPPTNVVMPAMVAGYLNPLAQVAAGVVVPGPTPTPTPTPVVPPSGGLSVALASNTPAGSYVAAGAAFNTFTNLNFSAGATPATVTSLTVTRTGLGSDSDVNNVYIFQGSQRLALSTTLGSGKATFVNPSGLFTVPANSTVMITIKADLISGLTVGKTYAFGINAASDVVTSGNGSVSGTFPIMGNLMSSTTLSNPSLATLGIQAVTVGTTVNAGTTNVLVGQFQFQASNSNVQVKQIILTEVGSINSANDLANVKLMNGATQVGSTIPHPNADGTSVFDLSANPYTITSGQNVTFNVYADVMGTPNRSFTMTIQRNYDVIAFDTTYGAGILSTAIGTCTSFPVQQFTTCGTANPINVQAGNLVVTTDPSSPTGNVATAVNNVVLSQFDVLASGEPVKLFSIPVQFTYTDTGALTCSNGATSLTVCDNLNFANLRLVDDQGVQLGSTFSTPSAGINAAHAASSNLFTFSFGSTASPLNYVIPANTKRVLSIKADILSTFVASVTAFHADITAGSANAQGTISLTNAATTANLGRTLTIVNTPFSQSQSGALGTQTFVKGATGVRVGSFLLLAGAGEAIALSSVTVATNSTATTTFQNLRVNVNGTSFGITQGSLQNTTNYTFSGNPVTIPVGGTAIVDVYEDIQTNATSGTIVPVSLVNAIGSGVTSGTARTATGGTIAGQSVVIAGSGNLVVSSDSGTVAASNVAMGQTGLTMATFKLTTGTNEGVNITSIKVTDTTTGNNAGAALSNIKLFDGQTMIGSAISALSGTGPFTATFQFSPAYHISSNTVKTLTIVADVNSYNSTSSFSGSSHSFGIAAAADVVSTGDGSGASITATGTATGNAQSVFRTNLTVTLDPASPNNQVRGISSTDQFVLYDFKAASNFDALLQQFNVTVTNSGTTTPIINAYKVRDVNGYITGAVVGTAATSQSGVLGIAPTNFTAVTDNITAGDLTINGTSVGAITGAGTAIAQAAAVAAAVNTVTATTGVSAAIIGTTAAANGVALYRATTGGDIIVGQSGTATTARTGLTAGTTRVVVPVIAATPASGAINAGDLQIGGGSGTTAVNTSVGAVTAGGSATGQVDNLVAAINGAAGVGGATATTTGVTAARFGTAGASQYVLIRAVAGHAVIVQSGTASIANTGLTTTPAAGNTLVNLIVALPANYTVSAGTTRVLTLEVDSTTPSWAHTGTTYNFVQPKITAVTWNDQGGSSANLPSLILPVVGGTNSY